ncbi:unnamed protein product [Pedinophyceae sp. YPF-701]|nr:unnamed protein product [Pedinophyceae sp. YPF-701]
MHGSHSHTGDPYHGAHCEICREESDKIRISRIKAGDPGSPVRSNGSGYVRTTSSPYGRGYYSSYTSRSLLDDRLNKQPEKKRRSLAAILKPVLRVAKIAVPIAIGVGAGTYFVWRVFNSPGGEARNRASRAPPDPFLLPPPPPKTPEPSRKRLAPIPVAPPKTEVAKATRPSRGDPVSGAPTSEPVRPAAPAPLPRGKASAKDLNAAQRLAVSPVTEVELQAGETVSSVLVRYSGSCTEEMLSLVREMNPSVKNLNLVQPGQTLIVPDRRPGFYEPTVVTPLKGVDTSDARSFLHKK